MTKAAKCRPTLVSNLTAAQIGQRLRRGVLLPEDVPKKPEKVRSEHKGRPRNTLLFSEDEIREMYRSGIGIFEIRKRSGASIPHIYKILGAERKPYKGRPPKPCNLSSTYSEEIIRLSMSGLSRSEIAKELGASRQSLSTMFRRYGVAKEPIVRPVTASKDETVRMFLAGLSRNEIARQRGVTRQAVSHLLIAAGYSKRNP